MIYPGFAGGDRTEIALPKTQQKLLEDLHKTGKPVVLVLMTGSALAVEWAKANLPAVLVAWYPGQQGGNAIADVLFGKVNPSGRLPVTFYKSVGDLPPFADYSMKNRTYKYFIGEPLYAFGHGLSYTRFDYTGMRIAPAAVPPRRPTPSTCRSTCRTAARGRGTKLRSSTRAPSTPAVRCRCASCAASRASTWRRAPVSAYPSASRSRTCVYDEAAKRFVTAPGDTRWRPAAPAPTSPCPPACGSPELPMFLPMLRCYPGVTPDGLPDGPSNSAGFANMSRLIAILLLAATPASAQQPATPAPTPGAGPAQPAPRPPQGPQRPQVQSPVVEGDKATFAITRRRRPR